MSPRPNVELFDRNFQPPEDGLPFELTTLDEMRTRYGDELLQQPGRVFFHVAIMCTSGEGLHEVDFTPVTVQPGRLVHVQPGQVHRWRLARSYAATVILFETGTAIGGRDGWPIGPRWFDLSDRERARSDQIIGLLNDELTLDRSAARRQRALRGGLELLMVNLGLDLPHQATRSNLPQPYLGLMDQLETERGWSRSVKERARRLGYSSRTLTRACQTATGRTAKEVIDNRIGLEARRLLIHEGTTVEPVARELSFSQASNFAKFFLRLTGENPDAWRTRHLAIPRR